MSKETPALFCSAYRTVDGYLENYNSTDLFVWAAVNAETGEVDRDDTRWSDDDGELEDILAPWEWRRFRLVPDPEDEKPTEDKPDADYSASEESMNRRLEGGGQPSIDLLAELDQRDKSSNELPILDKDGRSVDSDDPRANY